MKKMTSRERRAEERRILAEMNEAMQEQTPKSEKPSGKQKSAPAKTAKKYDDTMPETVHCKRCKTLMENGVCPACGFTIYVPMNEEKRNKIKLVLTVVAFVVFAIVFIAMQYKKG